MLEDVPFYIERVTSSEALVLELGCGTGRVLLPLTSHCAYIQGVDRSASMLAICRQRLREAAIGPRQAQVRLGDITDLSLGRTFDLIIAPYRVMQNLESDAQVEGLFATIRGHLSPDGSCILNVFRPNRSPDELVRYWTGPGVEDGTETPRWEVCCEGDRITASERRARIDAARLVIYPELVYRRYREGALIDEAVLKIAMRCYYPDAFVQLILDHGFQVIDKWGGYRGEAYGAGPELVVQFGLSP
jgi:SAM-dependent methyltransferase